jgi:hypothetical protein
MFTIMLSIRSLQRFWLLFLILLYIEIIAVQAGYPECGLRPEDIKLIYDEWSCTGVCDNCSGSGCNATSGAQLSQFIKVSEKINSVLLTYKDEFKTNVMIIGMLSGIW